MADTTVEGLVKDSQNYIPMWGPYWISTSVGIIVYVDAGIDLSFTETADGGVTWAETEIVAGQVQSVAVWFDQETPGDTGTLLHVTWLDSADETAYYITIDISDGTLGTQRTVDSGLTVSGQPFENRTSITKTVSGNIIAAFKTTAELECYKSSDNFATAGTDIADPFETTSDFDFLLLFPADTADNDDAAAIFWDRSANEISVKMWDDSVGDWTETLISGSMVPDAADINMDAVVRLSDNHILLVAHSNDDDAGDDLMAWDLTVDDIDSPTVTAKTNVVTNQAESGQAGIIINQQNDDVYVAYLKGGTWYDTVDVVYHKSSDGMGTWGSEEAYSEAAADDNRYVHGGRTVGSSGGRIQFAFYNEDLTEIFVNLVNDIEIPVPSVGATRRTLTLLGAGR